MKEIIHLIEHSKKTISRKDISIEHIQDVYKINALKSHINGPYVSEPIQNSLCLFNTCYKYSINCMNSNIVNIHVLTKKRKLSTKIENILHLYTYCAMNTLGRNKKGVTINVLFLHSNLKKKLNSKKIISYEHVNTGFAYVNNLFTTVNIVIYRKEEFFKTLLHEMIHFLNYHPMTAYESNYLMKDVLCGLKNIDDIHITEAYTEVLANRLNTLFVHCLSIENTNLNIMIKRENDHSIDCVCKIIKHYNLNHITDFYKCNIEYNERSHVFSYYILKSALLYDKTFENNYIIHLSKMTDLKSFVSNVIKSLKNKIWIDNISEKKKLNFNKSMRMTINDVTNYKIIKVT